MYHFVRLMDDPLHVAEPNKNETVISEACTRSGAFALLLAVVLWLLTMYWLDEKRDEAAAEYVADRANLALYLDTLDGDKIWQEYKQSHPDAESMPMSRLLHASVQITQQPVATASTSAPAAGAPPKSAHRNQKTPLATRPNSLKGAPEPPGALTAQVVALVELYEMTRIQEFMRKLNDSALLTRSREASNFFEFSIVGWLQKRNSRMYENAVTGVCQAPVIEIPTKSHRTTHYTPQVDDKALFDCLTLREVRDLAKFELPTVTNPAPMGRRVAQDVELSPGSFPRDPYMATFVAQTLLFFVLTYFAAFTREAIASEGFPSQGTLFGAFSRSTWTVAVFFLALWTPALACCGVAIASEKPVLAIGVIPIALVTLFAQRTLGRASFFGPLKPSAFLPPEYRFWRRNIAIRKGP